jgi:hypothetical protein
MGHIEEGCYGNGLDLLFKSINNDRFNVFRQDSLGYD